MTRDAIWRAARDRADAIIRAMWPAESSVTIAAAIGGVEPGVVRGRAQRMGLPPRKVGRPVTPSAPMDLTGRRVQHGSQYAYRLGCHCAPCIAANLETDRARNAQRRKARPAAPARVIPIRQSSGHGSLARFMAGCHCEQCLRAGVARDDQLHRPRPRAWRCPCDTYRINQGQSCAACGSAAPWLATQQGAR